MPLLRTPSAHDDDRPLVVWRAGVYWDAVVGTDRQLVSRLSQWVDVLWVDPPRSVASVREESHLLPHVTEVQPGVRRLEVAAPPWALRPGVLAVSERIVRAAVRWALRSDPRGVAALVGTTPPAGLAVVDAGVRAYYATDDFSSGAGLMGRGGGRMRELERRRLLEADVAGAVSGEITAQWARPGAFVLPNGVNADHYADVDDAPLPDDVVPGGPVVGMVGQLSSRIDLDVLEAIADTGVRLLLVGPRVDGWGGERFDALVARDHVAWVGEKSYAELPSYLRLMDVGITPYVDSAFNRASSPLKTLEYLAAGRAALSTPLPAVRALGTPHVACADADGFAAEAVRLAGRPRDPDLVRRRREVARSHDWETRAAGLLAHLELGWTVRAGPVREAGR
jgi:teichuronic acid biosynthesis glycosyltransferase TuaH